MGKAIRLLCKTTKKTKKNKNNFNLVNTHARTHTHTHTHLPQGEAVIIPAYPESQDLSQLNLDSSCNEGKPIRYLISAPTMRIPTNVSKTVNAYLAFRAILRAGK